MNRNAVNKLIITFYKCSILPLSELFQIMRPSVSESEICATDTEHFLKSKKPNEELYLSRVHAHCFLIHLKG